MNEKIETNPFQQFNNKIKNKKWNNHQNGIIFKKRILKFNFLAYPIIPVFRSSSKRAPPHMDRYPKHHSDVIISESAPAKLQCQKLRTISEHSSLKNCRRYSSLKIASNIRIQKTATEGKPLKNQYKHRKGL